MIKKPDLSMMLNGAIAALVAITAACAFVAPWAAILIGFVAGVIVVFGVLFVERIGIDDPVGALSAHGMAGVWGTLSLGFFTVPALAAKLETGGGGLFYGGGLHQLGVQALGLRGRRRVHVRRVVRHPLALQGHDRDPHRAEVETAGLDVSEHGMWGYPEFYIPVPGGYGTDTHGHLGVSHTAARSSPAVGGSVDAFEPQAGPKQSGLPVEQNSTLEQELQLALLVGREWVHVRDDDHQPIVASPDDRQHPEQVARMADDRAARVSNRASPRP